MANKMLIDASHPEETRVVVVRGNKVEEFDFESANRKQLRGNIYLAKVTRVEPSLQAAFVEYGGNRHGFLAFSEIHPDYYQIPVADRQALLEEEARAERDQDSDDERGARKTRVARRDDDSEGSEERISTSAEAPGDDDTSANETDDNGDGNGDDDHVEHVGGSNDALEEVPDRRQRPLRRQYKIQEVIKRRQVLLIQVVKEERGNKGAALTTYLSLAGRYSVLMPNTARGGGISRKITNIPDRKRLKAIAQELEVPEGMGVIVRTAGAARTKSEIKRDFEYLLRLWENVRELTLQSSAPALVYEEGSLIKRAIRDLYNKDIDEVLVSGDEGYREAKDFMRMLMPSHAKAVQAYKDIHPLFARHGVEAQLDAMFSSHVTLKSGGYIVINPTEALVSIDVNSGRSTREHNIEDTAYRTNLEAAEEVARQVRLRDLAGLIVIDFIDMEDKRNVRNVEKKLKDCLKNDRARIQVGRISAFGLMEMSRQRIRTGVLESSSVPCPHCAGTGFVRATPSIALHILRAIEEALLRNAGYDINVKTRTEVALYVLNQKRVHLRELETRFGVVISVLADDLNLTGTNYYALERGEAAVAPRAPATGVQIQQIEVEPTSPVEDEDEDKDTEPTTRHRRRPAAAERNVNQGKAVVSADVSSSDEDEADDEETVSASSDESSEGENGARRRRRRRRRGGRRNGENGSAASQPNGEQDGELEDNGDDDANETDETVLATGGSESVEAVEDTFSAVSEDTAGVDAWEIESAERVAADETDGDEANNADGHETDEDEPAHAFDSDFPDSEAVGDAAVIEDTDNHEEQPAPTSWSSEREVAAVIDETPRPKRSGWWSRKS
ncbi:ribonuclease E/G [Pseudochelatococcus contaminans]|uniref:Ribonuclease E n=1 Tax=Pseudochelatococcus contaminans TaxID=1538103 RepID=A0A7W6EFC4_9HYPH|nr:ribonuclease E/G [Pseudochelatococcus contaminans]MBB3808655.1 ribonuclease E [Pseudochelatococcus contaminans]